MKENGGARRMPAGIGARKASRMPAGIGEHQAKTCRDTSFACGVWNSRTPKI